ncbi:hypothetical protein L6452_03447 [Arctium lappa]|uniref:Uncharacterized protein n=1 Tax=Arctium lappa TaxID=4217 RepID=A0ACB9FN47_ARCLA|nr:hypothetical protein L6452_03447 [Arctium lappa]
MNPSGFAHHNPSVSTPSSSVSLSSSPSIPGASSTAAQTSVDGDNPNPPSIAATHHSTAANHSSLLTLAHVSDLMFVRDEDCRHTVSFDPHPKP